MPRRTSAVTAVLVSAVLTGGIMPAAASAGAGKTTDSGKSATAGSNAPVVTGRTDGDGDGRKNR